MFVFVFGWYNTGFRESYLLQDRTFCTPRWRDRLDAMVVNHFHTHEHPHEAGRFLLNGCI